MNKLTVKLKQHTPLIHFQHDQEGATLRASEVKPKLDKFLLEKLGDGDYEAGKLIAQTNKWIVEGTEKALNYKLSCSVDNMEQEKLLIETPPQRRNGATKYFLKYDTETTKYNKRTNLEERVYEDFPFLLANMGGKENRDGLVNLTISQNLIDLRIISFHSELIEFIKQHLYAFFAFNNFGQRSSKGFGSFTVKTINGENPISTNVYTSGTPLLQFSLKNFERAKERQNALFKTLDFYWKCLKSGINYTRNSDADHMRKRYIKAYLWTYLNGNENSAFTWEKKAVKTHFNLVTGREVSENDREATFARALLGCPDKFEYRFRDIQDINRKEVVSIKHNETDKENQIDRIPSPIVLKPIIKADTVYVYILINDTIKGKLNEVENKEFVFSCRTANDLSLNIDTNAINYQTLIAKYHSYAWRDNNMGNAIFYNVPSKLRESWSIIPRGFNWENILGDNEKVYFRSTK